MINETREQYYHKSLQQTLSHMRYWTEDFQSKKAGGDRVMLL